MNIKLPELGEGIENVEVTDVLVSKGSSIKIDDILIREKCYSFLYFNNKHILLLNSIDPLKLNIVKDQKLVNIFTYDKSIDSKYNFVGPILPFFNRFIGLICIGQKLYKIAVFEKQNLKAGEKATYVMTFYLDPEMVNDPTVKNLEDVTMSYTFFSTDYYKQS